MPSTESQSQIALPLDFLVLAPTPTHPQNYGNRKRIHSVCTQLKQRGHRVHFVHYPAEADWRKSFQADSLRAMQDAWDSVHTIAPSRPLHTHAKSEDHTIDEWWDPAVGQYIKWLCSIQRFDAIIVNYAWLSKALEFVPKGVFRILDTHDRCSNRRELLEANDIKREFFHTTPREEAIALNRADLVWAIKDQEREFFRTLTTRPVITLGHADPWQPVARRPRPGDEEYLVIGMLGARNNVNCRNIRNFLKVALPVFHRTFAPIRIRLAGSMCQDLQDLLELPEVEMLGELDDVDDFYAAVDVVIAPMTFSSGLKIKVSEALAAGAAIVGHAHAFEGFTVNTPRHALGSTKEIAESCVDILDQEDRGETLRDTSFLTHRQSKNAVVHAMQGTLNRLRDSMASVLIVPTEDVLHERSAARAQLLQCARVLSTHVRVQFHTAFPLSMEQFARLRDLVAPFGRVTAGEVESHDSQLTDCVASMSDLLQSQRILSVFFLGLPKTLPATKLKSPIPAYVDSEQPQSALNRKQILKSLEGHFLRISPTVGQPGFDGTNANSRIAGHTFGQVQWLRELPAPLSHWEQGGSTATSCHYLVLARRADLALASSIIRVLQTAGGQGVDFLIIALDSSDYSTDSASANSINHVSIRQVWVDLTTLGQRPRMLIDLCPTATVGAIVRHSCRLARIPVESPSSCNTTCGSNWLHFIRRLTTLGTAYARNPIPTN